MVLVRCPRGMEARGAFHSCCYCIRYTSPLACKEVQVDEVEPPKQCGDADDEGGKWYRKVEGQNTDLKSNDPVRCQRCAFFCPSRVGMGELIQERKRLLCLERWKVI